MSKIENGAQFFTKLMQRHTCSDVWLVDYLETIKFYTTDEIVIRPCMATLPALPAQNPLVPLLWEFSCFPFHAYLEILIKYPRGCGNTQIFVAIGCMGKTISDTLDKLYETKTRSTHRNIENFHNNNMKTYAAKK